MDGWLVVLLLLQDITFPFTKESIPNLNNKMTYITFMLCIHFGQKNVHTANLRPFQTLWGMLMVEEVYQGAKARQMSVRATTSLTLPWSSTTHTLWMPFSTAFSTTLPSFSVSLQVTGCKGSTL